MKKVLQLFVVIFLVITSAHSQQRKISKGNKGFEKFAYVDSREIYLKVIEKGYESQDLYQHLGDSYYFTAELIEAEKWYELLINKYEDSISSDYLYRYAQSLKSNKKYSEADVIMDKFYKANPLDSRASNFENEKDYLAFIELQSGRSELYPVAMNSENSDYAPSFYNDKLVFASCRSESNESINNHKWNEQPFSDLYVTNQGSEKAAISSLSKKVNTKYHESTAIFTKDSTTIYFTRNNYTNNKYIENDNGANLLKLYSAKKEDNKWQKATELPFNSDEYSIAHPALSPDEKTLYFVSDMPGGKGMSDLYKVSIEKDGYGSPISLGDPINTEGRETFPFIAKNGDLYFWSDGRPGLGGLDIFIAVQKEDGSYKDAYNVGKPVNSSLDDFTFIINSETNIGYFASNRQGGKGSDDIYSFKQVKPLITYCVQPLKGIVKDKNTNQILSGAIVLLFDKDGNVITESVSGMDGSFIIEQVYCDKIYAIRATLEKYNPDEVSFETTSILMDQVNKILYLTPKVPIIVGADLNNLLDLEPIYFDLDKSKIRPDAKIELEKVIAFMNKYPKLKIDIRSHTDSRANDAYNLNLSKRRNKATQEYIIAIGGVSSERIIGKGYGETQLVNECANGVSCSEEKHQLNRRSEFIIIEN